MEYVGPEKEMKKSCAIVPLKKWLPCYSNLGEKSTHIGQGISTAYTVFYNRLLKGTVSQDFLNPVFHLLLVPLEHSKATRAPLMGPGEAFVEEENFV